ncbi:MAG: toxin-antitoxin system HicB family antitoxin [Clostridia bacterium]|nr:toxin-antitoxin system HicB family antitoxin [Clostridia bacterium]
MAYNEAQKKATMKYQKEKLEQIAIRVPKGDRAALKEEAEQQGQSMAQYIIQAVNDRAGRQVLTPAETKAED